MRRYAESYCPYIARVATDALVQADGRVLHIYMKHGPPTPIAPRVQSTPTEPKPVTPDLFRAKLSYDGQRETSDRNRRRAEPEFQDGRYGFDSTEDRMDVAMDDERDTRGDYRRDSGRARDYGRGRDDRGLYSDGMVPRPRGRNFR